MRSNAPELVYAPRSYIQIVIFKFSGRRFDSYLVGLILDLLPGFAVVHFLAFALRAIRS